MGNLEKKFIKTHHPDQVTKNKSDSYKIIKAEMDENKRKILEL